MSDFKIRYKEIRKPLESLHEELRRQIGKIIRVENIKLAFPVQSRVKTWKSISEKLERLERDFSDLKEMQDLVGIRIVTVFEEDLKIISQCLDEIFVIHREYNTANKLKKDQFGYSSIHKVISFPEEWLNLPTLKSTKGLKAELQLRTAPQHIWAEASNILNYKKKEDVPDSIIRTIYRVSALLETVDQEFTKLIAQKKKYREEISDLGDDEFLNVDILEKILDEELPLKNKKDSELYADLLEDLLNFDLKKVQDLRKLLQNNYDQIIENEKERLEEIITNKEDNQDVYTATKDRIDKGIFYSHVGLTREGLSEKFGEEWLEYNLGNTRK